MAFHIKQALLVRPSFTLACGWQMGSSNAALHFPLLAAVRLRAAGKGTAWQLPYSFGVYGSVWLPEPLQSMSLRSFDGVPDEIARLEAENQDLRSQIIFMESSEDQSRQDSFARTRMSSTSSLQDLEISFRPQRRRNNSSSEDEADEVEAEGIREMMMANRWARLTKGLMSMQPDSQLEAELLRGQKLTERNKELQEKIESLQQQRHLHFEKLQLAQSLVQDEAAEKEHCLEALASTVEKLKSTEEECKVAKQHVWQLQDELEASQLESAQATMRLGIRNSLSAALDMEPLQEQALRGTAAITGTSRGAEPQLVRRMADLIRRNLILQRRLSGLLEWRSQVTVSKLQNDLMQKEQDGNETGTACTLAEALNELAAARLEHRAAAEEAEEYEDQLVQLQQEKLNLITQMQKAPKSPSSRKSRQSVRLFGAKLAELQREKGAHTSSFEAPPSSSEYSSPSPVRFSAMGASTSFEIETEEAPMLSELESALASKRKADEENQQLLQHALQASSHAEELVADGQRQNEKLRTRFDEECAHLRQKHSMDIQAAEEASAQRLLEDVADAELMFAEQFEKQVEEVELREQEVRAEQRQHADEVSHLKQQLMATGIEAETREENFALMAHVELKESRQECESLRRDASAAMASELATLQEEAASVASSNAQLLAFSNELQEELLTVQQQSVMDLAAMQRFDEECAHLRQKHSMDIQAAEEASAQRLLEDVADAELMFAEQFEKQVEEVELREQEVRAEQRQHADEVSHLKQQLMATGIEAETREENFALMAHVELKESRQECESLRDASATMAAELATLKEEAAAAASLNAQLAFSKELQVSQEDSARAAISEIQQEAQTESAVAAAVGRAEAEPLVFETRPLQLLLEEQTRQLQTAGFSETALHNLCSEAVKHSKKSWSMTRVRMVAQAQAAEVSRLKQQLVETGIEAETREENFALMAHVELKESRQECESDFACIATRDGLRDASATMAAELATLKEEAAAAASLNAQLAFSKELQAGIASSDWQSLPVCHIQVKQVSQEDSARAAISEIQQEAQTESAVAAAVGRAEAEPLVFETREAVKHSKKSWSMTRAPMVVQAQAAEVSRLKQQLVETGIEAETREENFALMAHVELKESRQECESDFACIATRDGLRDASATMAAELATLKEEALGVASYKAAAAASLNAQLAFSKELQAGIASSDWQSLPVCHIQVKQVSQEDSARAAISEIQQEAQTESAVAAAVGRAEAELEKQTRQLQTEVSAEQRKHAAEVSRLKQQLVETGIEAETREENFALMAHVELKESRQECESLRDASATMAAELATLKEEAAAAASLNAQLAFSKELQVSQEDSARAAISEIQQEAQTESAVAAAVGRAEAELEEQTRQLQTEVSAEQRKHAAEVSRLKQQLVETGIEAETREENFALMAHVELKESRQECESLRDASATMAAELATLKEEAAAAASLNAQLAFSKELQAGIASSDWQSLPVCHIQVKQVSQEDSARAAISEIQQEAQTESAVAAAVGRAEAELEKQTRQLQTEVSAEQRKHAAEVSRLKQQLVETGIEAEIREENFALMAHVELKESRQECESLRNASATMAAELATLKEEAAAAASLNAQLAFSRELQATSEIQQEAQTESAVAAEVGRAEAEPLVFETREAVKHSKTSWSMTRVRMVAQAQAAEVSRLKQQLVETGIEAEIREENFALMAHVELKESRQECQSLRRDASAAMASELATLQEEAASVASSNAQLLAFSNELQEELLTVQQQSVMDLAAMQRSERAAASLRSLMSDIRHAEESAAAREEIAIDKLTAMRARFESETRELAAATSNERRSEQLLLAAQEAQGMLRSECGALTAHVERAAAAESVAQARTAEVEEQRKVLRQECHRLRSDNVVLRQQIHGGSPSLQDIKIVAAARHQP
ncbi:unnamed protein product [Symbiodinium natans]|uniref:Uncharacterized protein n=1 Tax=Symbiodinium natans TaxID=878477 RepID=A0A812I5X6_9DINO|nr:unnamed protein product [Symbiodinium natans]